MGLDDPRDLLEFVPIVSRAVLESGAVQPELRMAAATLNMDVRWLTSVVHAEAEPVAGLAMECGHGEIISIRAYRALTIGL